MSDTNSSAVERLLKIRSALRLLLRFTLIELLIVIAIITILIAILAPALGSAKKMGLRIGCANNGKTLFQASSFYSNDYNSYIPFSDTNAHSDSGDELKSWHERLMEQLDIPLRSPRVSDSKLSVFLCPADSEGMNKAYPANNNNIQTTNFAPNGYVMGNFSTFTHDTDRRLESFARPSGTIYFWDRNYRIQIYAAQTTNPCNQTDNLLESGATSVNWIPLHNRQSNFFSLDGHIECMKFPPYNSKLWKGE
jgi:prepilin-type N-terminal cleavage/methylation domain-containing protein